MDQSEYFRTHPPRCLEGFIATPTELPGADFDGHPSLSQLNIEVPGVTISAPEHINPVFAIACQCGGNRHFVHCYRWFNPSFNNVAVTLSPFALECATCRKITSLLDTDIHGYDAELGNGSVTMRAAGEEAVYDCPACGRQPLEVFARFEYPDDLFESDFSDFAGREQELFTWFSLLGKCPGCAQVLSIAEFECA